MAELRQALEAERARREAAEDEVYVRSLLLESVNDAVVSMDLHGRVWGWNRGAERMYGYPAGEVVGRALPDVRIDGTGEELTTIRRHLLEKGRWEGEVAHRRASGDVVMVHSSVAWIHDRRGERIGIVAVNRDVTERRRAQQERREAEQRLRQIVDRVDVVLYVREAESGAIPYLSPAFERVWGRRPSEVQADPALFLESIHFDDRTAVDFAHARVLSGRTAEEAYRIVRPDGTVRWIRDRLYPEVDVGGRVRLVMGIAEDITETKRLEADLRQAQKLEAVGTLASGIAHDFNNLLMGIAGCVEIALDTLPEPSPARMYLDEIRTAAVRGRSITRQLLHFARRRESEDVVVDAHRLLRDCERLVERILGEDITTEWSLDAEQAHLRCDPAELEQVVLNLCANARAAMPDGGRLRVATRNAPGPSRPALGEGEPWFQLIVSDDGCGMSEETRARVFDPFFTTKKPGEGTGLGLSSVYGIVQRLGGRIDVASEKGRGATFDIYLPCAPRPKLEVPAPVLHAHIEPSAGGKTILLVEDDRLVRMSVRYYLEQAGYRVLDAEDGVAAMDCIDRFPHGIDLLLTDMVLPGHGGRAIADALRSGHPETKVLFMSAHTEEQLVTDGRLGPGDLAVQKPLSKEILLRSVREALNDAS